ncbi:MAG: hypothetical protein Q8P02_02775 [Candidatus Micrarchaeota archaeon]|nr:hypothetical protein [Candidatus Micrarchaeota archaeon]
MPSEISYERLRLLLGQERHSPSILSLEDDCYTMYLSFLADLEANVRSEFSLEAAKELENAKKALFDLFGLRTQKIFFRALKDFRSGRVDTNGLSGKEKELYTGLITLLSKHQLRVPNGAPPAEVSVEAVLDVPAFVGFDAKPYGPYKPGDIARLPKKQADLLQRKGLVKVVS